MFSKVKWKLIFLMSLAVAAPVATLADNTSDPKTVASKAYVDTKQTKIDVTTDTYVYNESTNPTAAGSVVTTTTTAGSVGQVGIATAPTYNGNTLTNSNWIPTMGAMMTAISNATPPPPSGTPNNVATYDSNGDLSDGLPTANAAVYTNSTLTNGTSIATITAVETKQPKIAAGTSGNVVTYTGTAGSVGSAAISSAATYSNDTLTNGSDIANITAVETKVSKTQSTGYQVLTTGTSGTVTPDYLQVPVTTSGTGRPTSTNAPTSTAAVWIE